MRGHSQIKDVFINRSVSENEIFTVSDGFPLGRGIRRLFLDVKQVIVRDAGTLVAADADMKFLRALSLYDNRGNQYLETVPGVMLYRLNQFKAGTAARRTAIAATSGTYRTLFIVDFSDPLLARPDDTIIDTQDIDKLTMQIAVGNFADFLTTSGTESLTTTMNCYVDCTADRLPSGAKGDVKYIQNLSMLPQIDPSSRSSFDVYGTKSEYLKRLHVLAANSGSAYPCAGTPAANILATLAMQSFGDEDYRNTDVALLSALAKSDYKMETEGTGLYSFDLAKGKSIMESKPTYEQQIQLKWTTDTLSTSRLNVLQERLTIRK